MRGVVADVTDSSPQPVSQEVQAIKLLRRRKNVALLPKFTSALNGDRGNRKHRWTQNSREYTRVNTELPLHLANT
jgi:hypothetical protein